MKIFRATDLRINSIPIIADDTHHASHTLLRALYEDGLRHWPGVSYSLGPWSPPDDMAPEIIGKFAREHTGGLAHFVEGGWEIIRSDPYRTYP